VRSSRNISGVTLGGERQRQLGVSAPGVEHIAAGLAGGDQRGQFRLRLSDIPRRRPLEDVRLSMHTVQSITSFAMCSKLLGAIAGVSTSG
jgi:hypothetical protein